MAINRRGRGRGAQQDTHVLQEATGTRRRNRRSSPSQEPPNYGRYLFFVVVLVTAIVLGYYVYIYDFTIPENKRSSSPSISQILKMGVSASEELLAHELQVDAFFLDGNIAQLIKRKLSPVQDRVSSLRTQTSQYEEMEHIPGGPSHFISTTLDELERLDAITAELSIEVQYLTTQMTQHGRALSEDVSRVIDQNLLLIRPSTLEALGENGIILAPMEYSEEPGYVEKIAQGRTFDEVLRLLGRLGGLYEKLEENEAQFLQTLEENGITEWKPIEDVSELPDAVVDVFLRIEEQKKKIDNEILRNSEIYKLYLPLKSLLNHRLLKSQERMLAYVRNQAAPYVKIKGIIQKDIQQLKVRVQNLKYTYVKRNLEL